MQALQTARVDLVRMKNENRRSSTRGMTEADLEIMVGLRYSHEMKRRFREPGTLVLNARSRLVLARSDLYIQCNTTEDYLIMTSAPLFEGRARLIFFVLDLPSFAFVVTKVSVRSWRSIKDG